MKNSYSSLSVAIKDLQENGYEEDFNLVEEGIESKNLKKEWKAGQLDVKKYYRFEGMTNPGDNSILYVIETDDGTQGLLVDNYGAGEQNISPDMIQKLKIHHDA
ncbi:phosphoribosylpyrophosphate synthetase [Luteirhabdus pelagi]|uniref:phosphoribosylpyrophosphate synthetase n=1 Tax=Luteirhabdus pelagi TaxID=2792783 RepID=UPI00193969F9|nr:phosphoribosylpyrophosphate synthetase [Luteirhabdus pelagi]